MKPEVLTALLVVEYDAVIVLVGAAPHAGRPDAAKLFLVRQLVRRHILLVVDAADDQRLIRIAILESHHHLMTDARPEERAPAFARPKLRHPQPA